MPSRRYPPLRSALCCCPEGIKLFNGLCVHLLAPASARPLKLCAVPHTDPAFPCFWLCFLEHFLCHLGQVSSVFSSTKGGSYAVADVKVLCDHESRLVSVGLLSLMLFSACCSKLAQELLLSDCWTDWLLRAPASPSVSSLCLSLGLKDALEQLWAQAGSSGKRQNKEIFCYPFPIAGPQTLQVCRGGSLGEWKEE